MGIGNTLAIFKTNQQAFLSVECLGIFSSLPNCRGEEGHLWRVQEEGPKSSRALAIRDEKVTNFVNFEIILPLFCF